MERDGKNAAFAMSGTDLTTLYWAILMVGTLALTALGGEPSDFDVPAMRWDPAGVAMRVAIIAVPTIVVCTALVYWATSRVKPLWSWTAVVVGAGGMIFLIPMRGDIADIAAYVGSWLVGLLFNAAVMSAASVAAVGVLLAVSHGMNSAVAPAAIPTQQSAAQVEIAASPNPKHFCLDCGEPLVEGKAFCGSCGSKVEG